MEQDDTPKVDSGEKKPAQEITKPPSTPDEIALAGYETINYLILRGLLEKK